MEKEFQKCEECAFSKAVKNYWREEYIEKKATVIIRTVTITLSIVAIIINTILILKN